MSGKGARFTLEQVSAMRPEIRDQVAGLLYPAQKGPKPPVLLTYRAPDGTKATVVPPRASKRRLVAKSRNGGAWSEAAYWQAVRSTLRRGFRFWKPAQAALRAARVAYGGRHGAKWAYLCADCKRLFRRQEVQIDHVEPCGALTSLEHVADFLRRLTPEDVSAYRVRCLKCHAVKTAAERGA